jgi:hypothetical protein
MAESGCDVGDWAGEDGRLAGLKKEGALMAYIDDIGIGVYAE